MALSHCTRENTELIAVLNYRQDTDVDKYPSVLAEFKNITESLASAKTIQALSTKSHLAIISLQKHH